MLKFWSNLRMHAAWSFVLFTLVLSLGSACSQDSDRVEISIYHYEQFEAVLDSLGFSMENWQAGIREVPRVYVTDIPQRWGKVSAKEVTVTRKKRIFYRALLPLILRAQEVIAADRVRAKILVDQLSEGAQLDADDQAWLLDLALKYRVVKDASDSLTDAQRLELLKRVDIIPASLALAQAAYESGYGTSRFAGLGNALYGQWAWGEGIKPDGQRAEHGDHRIAAFDNPLTATLSYMHNLNTHNAYAGLRDVRAQMRVQDKPLDGWELAGTLDKYSERGQEYVDTLQGIMKYNKLLNADAAYLRDMIPVLLVPAGTDGPDS